MNTRYQLKISKVFRTHVINGAEWVRMIQPHTYIHIYTYVGQCVCSVTTRYYDSYMYGLF